jgi:hypothetical protein
MSQISDYQPSAQPSANQYAPQHSGGYTPQSYAPTGASGSSYAPQTPITEQPPSNVYSSPQPLNNFDGNQMSNPYTPPEPAQPQFSGYEPPASSGYEPPSSSGYEPPASGGYEPPSSGYTPYEPNDEPDSPVETRPKKKSFMDDDDDIPALKRPTDTREKTKAEKDREADEAFRKAAEADGKSDSLPSTLPY